jgi:hypothetical protein
MFEDPVADVGKGAREVLTVIVNHVPPVGYEIMEIGDS